MLFFFFIYEIYIHLSFFFISFLFVGCTMIKCDIVYRLLSVTFFLKGKIWLHVYDVYQ
ncbi:hypothetical protein BDF21DRAFT_491385, partial [Thamnidium elegans]